MASSQGQKYAQLRKKPSFIVNPRPPVWDYSSLVMSDCEIITVSYEAGYKLGVHFSSIDYDGNKLHSNRVSPEQNPFVSLIYTLTRS